MKILIRLIDLHILGIVVIIIGVLIFAVPRSITEALKFREPDSAKKTISKYGFVIFWLVLALLFTLYIDYFS